MAKKASPIKKNFLKISPIHIAVLFFLLLLGLILREHFVAIMVIAFLYIIDIVFDIFLRFTLRPVYVAFPVGIELVTMNTVIAGVVFGPIVGLMCGLLFGMTYYGIVFNFASQYQLINIPFYALIGFLAGTLPIENIVVLGMTLSAIYAFSTSFLVTVLMAGRISKSVIFIVTNLFFNYWLFTNLSPIILNIIA